jgi:hypothetical protein
MGSAFRDVPSKYDEFAMLAEIVFCALVKRVCCLDLLTRFRKYGAARRGRFE